MENNQSGGGNGAIIAVLVLVVVVIAGWVGYKQGVFGGKQKDSTININLPGSSPSGN